MSGMGFAAAVISLLVAFNYMDMDDYPCKLGL